MTMYSLQKALDKINLLDAKIQDATNALRTGVMTYTIGKKVPNGYESVDQYNEKAKSLLQSVNDLIKQRDKLKTAIINANATTIIEVASEKMSIAAAIERRQSIVNRRNLLTQLRNIYSTTMVTFEREQARYREGLDVKISALTGKENKTKHDLDDTILNYYKSENEPVLIDPLNLREEIENLTKYIAEFDYEVKFALTEANVETKIEIED